MESQKEGGVKFAHSLAFVCLFYCVATLASSAQTVSFTTLVNFNNQSGPQGAWTSGDANLTSLVQGRDGNLYGTTQAGGAPASGFGCGPGNGTFFKMTPGGSLTTLHVFHQCISSTDGAFPQSGIILGSNGSFFGTTQMGGPNSPVPHDGTVFRVTPGGTFTTLFDFPNDFNNPPTKDGSQPVATLVQGTDGNFYGANVTGGANSCGTVFKMTAGGSLTPLQSFPMIPFCDQAFGTLIQAVDANFYGTTRNGGTHSAGTIYKVSPSGAFTTFYSFKGSCGASCTSGPFDGQNPNAGLVQGNDGNFYGTTENGGTESGGTVFKITPGGAETVLHSFGGTAATGSMLDAPLILASDGNFYGTTLRGGPLCSAADTCGTIFKITPGGLLTTIHVFNGKDGWAPTGGLVQYTDGSFYGMTSQGGQFGFGTIFHFSVGLGPFITVVPAAAKVGGPVNILGNKLTGTTSVKFNGTAAAFTVVSDTDIATAVPGGAVTGTVQVVTPGGTRSSIVKFRVLPVISSFSPSSAAVGATVVITGQSFTGTTSVAFGGVKASFMVNSYTMITAVVPSGAKTGKITVTTPGGTTTSGTSFTVL